MDESSPLPLPLWVWNNKARLTLSPGLYAWLALLVLTVLASVFFLTTHNPARWVLGGFVASHTLVVIFGQFNWFTMRRGWVSSTHVLCWSPGWTLTMFDAAGRSESTMYAVWSIALSVIVGVAFLFDVRDAGRFLYYLATGVVRLDGSLSESAD